MKPPPITRRRLSGAIAELMPSIIRGVQLDFFVQKGVTQTQFVVLVAIHAGPRCTMGALAKSLHVRMPTMTGIVDRLVRNRYVRRFSDPRDRRQVMVEATPKGHAFIRECQAVMRRRWEDVLRELEAGELEAFYSVVTKLKQRIGQD